MESSFASLYTVFIRTAMDVASGFNLSDYVVGGAPRPQHPAPRPQQEDLLKRNDTGFPMKATAKLRELYERYLSARASAADAEHGWASALKYYQYLVRAVMSSPEYGIGADGNARGLLIFHTMGMGKTRLAVAVAMAVWDLRPVVVMLARNLQENFRETVGEVVAMLASGRPPEAVARLRADAVARFTFVSMDAYNAAEQLARGTGANRAKRSVVTGGIDNSLLIVDEAHNLFRAIINSSAENANARRIYDMIMTAHNLRLIFLTGTPAAKDPFELVPCFNMLAGNNLLPVQYETFYSLYVDRAARTVRNRERLANRLIGLVSHVTPRRPSEPANAQSGERAPKKARDVGWFPEERPTITERVEMGVDQYRQYLLAREKENAEGGSGEGDGGRGVGVMSTPALALPGSEKKAMRSYYVKSRTLSTFCPPREWASTGADAMPESVFTDAIAPKLALIADRADRAPGPILVYSQFIEAGLKPLGRVLQRLGYSPFIPALPPKKKKTAPAEAAPAEAAPAEAAPAEAAPAEAAPADFPYRRLFAPPFNEMLARLRETARAPPPEWGLPREGRLALVERSYPGDYDAADCLTDWEAEPVRMRCREARRPSPAETWKRLREDPALPAPLQARRELVYKSARGCNLFNPALGTFLLQGAGGWGPAEGPGDVLDPTAGWGDRLGAAFIAGARSYRGWDTNPDLQPVYAALASRYERAGLTLDWRIECAPFEDALVAPASADTVLTSPPFYDQELYEGAATSTTAHAAVEDWYAGFFRPLWSQAARALRPGGRAIAYVPPGRMFEEADRVLRGSGLQYLGAVGFRQVGGGTPGAIRDAHVWRLGAALGGAPPKGFYATIFGEVSGEARAAIKAAFNAPANAHGAVIKAILISKTGAEGLDLKWLRETHQVEPYWDKARDHQVTARAVRLGSHDGLPEAEREVQPYLYVATANQEIYQQMPPSAREEKTIDELFCDRADARYETNAAFRQLLSEVCFECELFGYGACRVCAPSSAPLFHDDPALDVRLPDPCEARREADVEAAPVEVGGATYYYKADPSDPRGYAFYEYRDDLGGYARVDPGDPVTAALVRAVAG